jgi:wobble nucleotide-excising tRNase
MISKISIKKFGIFEDYQWDTNIPGKEENHFKKINIIYGRNYSGKTTLARLFRWLETGVVHPDYQDAQFSVFLHENIELNELNFIEKPSGIQCRVYSTDFIRENLSWLHKDDGTIEPFTILGSVNVEIERQIQEISARLGDEKQENGGLLYQEKLFVEKISQLNAAYTKNKSDFEENLSRQAKYFKDHTRKYTPSVYHRTHLERDIPLSLGTPELTETQRNDYINILGEVPLDNLDHIPSSNPKIRFFLKEVRGLLNKRISPTKPIAELLADHFLQEWVRHGKDYHRDKREKCAFCGGDLTESLWNKIDAHFSKESDDFRAAILELISEIEVANSCIAEFLQLNKSQFYSCFHEQYDVLYAEWSECSKKYAGTLELLIKGLRAREQNIFTDQLPMIECDDYTQKICEILKGFNELVDENNNKTKTLSDDQETAKQTLLLNDVRLFALTIDYEKTKKNLDDQKNDISTVSAQLTTLMEEISQLTERKRKLESQAKDESRGAELVNTHLSRFFGHDELKLVAEKEGTNVKFNIVRQGQAAKNMSEGECSLISFCYFIAKIEDELQNGQTNQNLIIYIDDPISSLDSNHIFFMFSLIDSVIAKPKKFGQLFIATHNLDFLRYTKRLSGVGARKLRHYMVERHRRHCQVFAVLVPMPRHLKNFTTEFNYLFSKIYSVVHCHNSETHDIFYDLPNNMRKFLECYLYYKFPNENEDPLKNLDKLFDGHTASLINRIVNEFSHLTHIDRAMKPVEPDELKECARFILEKIESEDPNQFKSLVESVPRTIME